jgi:acylphosphatase
VNEGQDSKTRVHIWVTGRVQGVGFRAHVAYYAIEIGVNGWVRNVGMDTVESIAEGERSQLDRFIEMVKQGPPGSRVNDVRIEWDDATGEFVEFIIKHSI